MAVMEKLGRYTVLRRLSSGGMGEVFIARQEGLAGFEKLVVLKTLRADLAERQRFRDMFFEEARVSALARHANVVSVLDVGIDRGVYYLVMEYIEGWSMRQLLDACERDGRAVPLPHVLTLAIDVASGLDHIHSLRDASGNPLKLVHRDVSPENIMITIDGLSKLVDFGIAKRQNSPIHTEPGVLKGKARYLAPEQIRGGAVCAATDQFALASVLFEICTGEPLFPGKTTVEIMFALGRGVIRDARELRDDLPDELVALLERSLARDPGERLDTCGELADELVKIQTACDMRETRADLVAFLDEHLERPRSDGDDGGREAREHAGQDSIATSVQKATAVGIPVGAGQRRKLSSLGAMPTGSFFSDSSELEADRADDFADDFVADSVSRARDSADASLSTGPIRRSLRVHGHRDPEDLVAALAGRGGQRSEFDSETQIGRLVGRSQEIERIQSLFGAGARLVTLLGPGGVGKTSLARHHAFLQRRRASDREVYFCDLSCARSVDQLAYAMSEVLSMPLNDEMTWHHEVEHIGQELAGHDSILLILDNLEQIIAPAAAAVERWLDIAPKVCFLATSREPLNLSDEQRIDIQPLAKDEAVDLLCHRIRSVRPGWSPSRGERGVAEQIVEKLDGLPLAIELAAARGGVLTITQLLGRLTSRMDWLRSRRRDVASRHASLIDTIAWSWGLLDPWERAALAQCSLFHGGFTLVAAEAVIKLPDDVGCEVIDVVQSLREKSLLYTDTPRGAVEDELRFRMYESIRSFAADQLEDEQRRDAVTRHLVYFSEKAEMLASGVNGPEGASCLDRMAASLENFSVALDTARDTEPALAMRLVLAVEPMLAVHGPAQLHVEWLAIGLEAARSLGAVAEVARLLEARGLAAVRRGESTAGWADLREAIELAEDLGDSRLIAGACEAMCVHHLQRRELTGEVETYRDRAYDIYRQLADREGEARILGTIALHHQRVGRHAEAARCFDEAIALHERMGNVWAAGKLYGRRGLFRYETGQLGAARRDLQRSSIIVRQFGDVMREASNFLNLSSIELELGNHDAAERHIERAENLYRRAGHRPSRALAHVNRAIACLDRQEPEQAGEHLQEALQVARDTEYPAWELIALGCLGIAAHATGDLGRARAYLETVREVQERYPTSWASLSTFLAHLGATLAAQDELDSARAMFAQCRDRIERGNHPQILAVVQCLEGFCNLAEARAASPAAGSGDSARGDDASDETADPGDTEARRHIDRARRRTTQDAGDSCDLRIAQSLLSAAITRAENRLAGGETGGKTDGSLPGAR